MLWIVSRERCSTSSYTTQTTLWEFIRRVRILTRQDWSLGKSCSRKISLWVTEGGFGLAKLDIGVGDENGVSCAFDVPIHHDNNEIK